MPAVDYPILAGKVKKQWAVPSCQLSATLAAERRTNKPLAMQQIASSADLLRLV
jgi:hypothetical protein